MKRSIAFHFCLFQCLCGKTWGLFKQNSCSRSACTLLALARARSHSARTLLALCSHSDRTLIALARTAARTRSHSLALCSHSARTRSHSLALCSHSAPLFSCWKSQIILKCVNFAVMWCGAEFRTNFCKPNPETTKMPQKVGLLRMWFFLWHFSNESRSNPAWFVRFSLQIAELTFFQGLAWIRVLWA